MTTLWLSRFATASVLLTLAGCAMPGLLKSSKDEFSKSGPKNPVIRVLGMWQAADGMALNKSMRGFSGQLLFFTQNSDLAAEVNGDVQIYVFDDQGTSEEQAMPFQQCRYDAGAWKAHMGQGPLGTTYSVFVPYTRPGNYEAKCALRIRYTPKDGQPVYSEMVNVMLPGRKRKGKAPDDASEDSNVTGPEGQKDSGEPSDQEVSGHKPPHARGISTTIPTQQAIQDQLQAQHRVPAAKLDAKERRRIMREAAARLDSSKDIRHVAHAGYEEPETEVAESEEVSLEQDGQPQQEVVEHSSDTDKDDESAAPVKSPRIPAMQHVLDDED